MKVISIKHTYQYHEYHASKINLIDWPYALVYINIKAGWKPHVLEWACCPFPITINKKLLLYNLVLFSSQPHISCSVPLLPPGCKLCYTLTASLHLSTCLRTTQTAFLGRRSVGGWLEVLCWPILTYPFYLAKSSCTFLISILSNVIWSTDQWQQHSIIELLHVDK